VIGEGKRPASGLYSPWLGLREGMGELRAATIVGGRAVGRMADIRAPPLRKL
jgi:hypothetical protein